MAVPNQKIIKINKEPCDKEHLYTSINLHALQLAILDLRGEAFKLWLYLSKNQNLYQFELSQKAVTDWTGISRATYYRAIEELTSKGYLVQNDGSSLYTFYELPQQPV